MLHIVHGYFFRFVGAAQPGFGAAVFFQRRVHDHFISALFRHTDAVVLVIVGGEVKYRDQILAVSVYAAKGDHRVAVVVGADPLESLPAVINLPQCRVRGIKVVQFLREGL